MADQQKDSSIMDYGRTSNEQLDRFNFGDMNARTELATLAVKHLQLSQCASGKQILASGPCDHCGSTDPTRQCLFAESGGNVLGDPLNT